MRVLIYLPTLSGYRDRALTLFRAAEGIERLVLLVGRADDPELAAAAPSTVRLVDADLRTGQPIRNRLRLRSLTTTILREELILILHDTFAVFLPLFLQKKRYPHLRFLVSLYCLNAWRIRHVWKETPLLRLLRHRDTALMFFGRLTERLLCRRADRIIMQAPGLIERLREDYDIPDGRLAVIPNAIDVSFWQPESDLVPPEPGRLRLLSVGTLGPSRGLFVHLETLRRLRADGLDATLTLSGAVERSAQADLSLYLRQFRLEPFVRLAGRLHRTEVREELRSHDLFLYHTQNDASPRSVLEALAGGLPVIASRHPGIDALDPEATAISFTDFGDAASTAAAARRAAEPGEWGRRSSAARTLAKTRFDIAPVASEYVNLYRSLDAAGSNEAST